MDPCELDPNFEPQTRARSNTWPLRPNREVLEAQSSPVSEDSSSEAYKEKDPLGLNTKKSGSRRNAWGNLSYADLITKAIQSSPEKRLTLSQIYDWMVQNVPYFKDKGDSTSSAGWKNSIRHNLSLHSRFMRIQNEGTGKSSWWVINPDARPGKTPRRRAGSMETKSYEKKRGRVKKKVEALRAAMENGGSPNASNDDFLDPTFGSLQFGSSEFRPRASSNASSCGRLSPIQAAAEPDLHDNQVPPMSPIPWVSEEGPGSFYGGSQDGFTDQLVDTLVDRMHLGETTSLGITGSIVATNMQEQYMGEPNNDLDMSEFTSNSTFNQSSNFDNQFQNLPAPPPYPDLQCNSPQPAAQQPRQQQQQPAQQQQQQGPVLTNLERVPMGRAGFANMNLKQNGMSVYRQQDLFRECQLSINTQVGSPARSPQPSPQTYVPRLSPCPSSTTAHQNGTASPAHVSVSPCHRQLSPVPGQPSPAQPSSPSNQAHARSLLQQRQQLQQEQQQLRQQLQQQQQQQGQQIPQVSILRNALTGSYQSNASSQQYPAHLLNHFNAQLNSGHLPAGKPFCSTDNGLGGGGGGGGNVVRMEPPNTSGDSMEQTQDVYMNGESTPTGNCNTSVPIDIDVDNLMRGLEYDMDQVIKQELSLEGNLDFNFESVGSGVSAAQNQNVVR